jgi:hypothetical protein
MKSYLGKSQLVGQVSDKPTYRELANDTSKGMVTTMEARESATRIVFSLLSRCPARLRARIGGHDPRQSVYLHELPSLFALSPRMDSG